MSLTDLQRQAVDIIRQRDQRSAASAVELVRTLEDSQLRFLIMQVVQREEDEIEEEDEE